MAEQLVLGMQCREDHRFETYLDPSDGKITDFLANMIHSTMLDRFVYIWGADGVGKTHLLNAICQRSFEQGLRASYFDCEQLVTISGEALDGIDSMDVVCMDNVETLAGNSCWQESVFNLYNRCRDNGHTRLIVSSNSAPTQLPIELQDLKSRLAWGASFKIEMLEDEKKKFLLKARAHLRGFELSDSVIEYILTHYGRDLKHLVKLLDHLDDASLREHRKITIPFVRKVLAS